MFKRFSKKEEIEEVELLDSDEQDRIAKTLLDEAVASSKNIRQIFSWIYYVIAAMFVVILSYSTAYPMEMNHQAVFQDRVPHYVFQVFYALSIVSLYGNASYIKGDRVTNGLTMGSSSGVILALISLGLCGMWAYIFWLHGVLNPVLYWIPLANICAFGLAVYIDRDMADIVVQAEKIKSLKYEYRSL